MNRQQLEDRISAILDRDDGSSYTTVLARYRLKPNQFHYAVTRKLDEFIDFSVKETKETLEAIKGDVSRQKELFNMGEACIKAQYDKFMAGTQGRFHNGSLIHPENINHLVYYALTYYNPQLASSEREKVIEGIKGLPSNLGEYFANLRLGGLMHRAFEKGKKNSPLAVLEVFDVVYQRKTGDVSLFDLTQEEHLHKWGDNFSAPQSYWQNQANVEEAVYHTLTENCPELASQNREEVIEGIKGLPSNLHDYLHSIGLVGLMQSGLGEEKKDSPLAVLEVFDVVYQRKTGDVSLFDLTQEEHLHKWGDNFYAPRSYWQNQANVEEAVYHTLIENCPELASQKREEVIEGIKGLPSNLGDYLRSIGLGGLMHKAFEKGKEDSPLAVLEVFDGVYQRKTGDVSLFDLSQDEHVHRWGDNFYAPRSYWQNQANVEEAVYHTLTENCPELASQNREEVIEGIKGLPIKLQDYLHSIGLGGLMNVAFEKGKQGSPLAVLEVFDQVYQEKTGNPSLFDKTQGDYLEVETRNRLVRR